jgi:hypothetical protein
MLLLPNLDAALELIDRVFARIECRAAMRGADGDRDAGFADRELTGSVHESDLAWAEAVASFSRDRAHFVERHRRIRLVRKASHGPAVVLLSHHAKERCDGATRIGSHAFDQRLQVDGLGNELNVFHNA